MVQEIKYGVISDVHQDPRIVPLTIEVLKKFGVEKLLVNGDIGNHQKTLQDSQNYVAFILNSIGKSGLESFVQPGSHETLLAYGPVVEHFSGKFSNIVDVIRNPKVEQEGHQLVFLPGSDFLCGGEYQIGNHMQIPSGRYIKTEKGLMQFEEFGQYIGALQKGIAQGAMQYANMGDLRKLVNDPNRTVVICHVPRKFNDVDTAVDMAEFGEVKINFFADIIHYNDGEEQIRVFYRDGENGTILKPKPVENYVKNQVFKRGSVFPIATARIFKHSGAPIEIKRENRGNADLQTLYEELGIRKAVSGHFHESGHRACDKNGNPIQQNTYVDELFWNSGHLDAGQTGILTVNDGKISYRNIQLRDHLN